MAVIIKKVIVVLKWKGSIDKKIEKAQLIQTKITGNPRFPIPYPAGVVTLANYGTHISDLVTAENNVRNHTGSTETRDEKLTIVHGDIETLLTMIQNVMDANPLDAAAIAAGVGLDSKIVSVHPTRGDTAKPGENEGEVLLTGAGRGDHDWQASPDGGTTIVQLSGTRTGIKTLTGEPGGQNRWYRNRRVLPRDHFGAWSQWLKVRVP